MLKKNVKYTDFNGQECEETLYFNLTKAELTMLEAKVEGGMSNHIKEVVEAGDAGQIVKLFSDIIIEAYGVKSEDGKRFVKNSEMKEDFKNSAAYSELFMEIATNPEAAEAFMKAVTNQ